MAGIPSYSLADVVPTNIADSVDRLYVGQGQDSVAVGGSYLAADRGRIKALTMTGTSGTTIELYINNIPQFVQGNPSVDGRTYDNPSYYTYNRGDVIKVLATAGPTAGTVALDTESHQIEPRPEVTPRSARNRLRSDEERRSMEAPPPTPDPIVRGYTSFSEASSGIAPRSNASVDSLGTTHLTLNGGLGGTHVGGQHQHTNQQPPAPGPPKPGKGHK